MTDPETNPQAQIAKEVNVLTLPVANPLNIQATYSNIQTTFAAQQELRIVFSEVVMEQINGNPRL